MKRVFYLLSVFVLILGVSTAANAVQVYYDSGTNGNKFVSPVSGAFTETFNGVTPIATVPISGLDQPWTWTGSGAVVQNSLVNEYAAPYGPTGPNSTPYMTVPYSALTPKVVTVNFGGGTYNYFGLWWGSVDTYNTIDFYLSGALVQSYTGPMLAPPGNRSWTDPTQNLYVNFYFDALNFDQVSFTSTQKAFRVDNIAIAKSSSFRGLPSLQPHTFLAQAFSDW